MLENQNYKCKICLADNKKYKRQLAVDHCHTTGKIRGLLCTPCNISLGYINDNIQILHNMINYLKEYKEVL